MLIYICTIQQWSSPYNIFFQHQSISYNHSNDAYPNSSNFAWRDESSLVLKIELGIIYMHITNPMYPTNQLCMKLSVFDIATTQLCLGASLCSICIMEKSDNSKWGHVLKIKLELILRLKEILVIKRCIILQRFGIIFICNVKIHLYLNVLYWDLSFLHWFLDTISLRRITFLLATCAQG